MLYCTLELMPWLEAAWAGRVLEKSQVPTCLGGSLLLYDTDSEWACMDAAKRKQWENNLLSLVQKDPNHNYRNEIVLVPTIRGQILMKAVNDMALPVGETK